MRLPATILAGTMVLIGSTGAFAAQMVSTGPIFMNTGDEYKCGVANVSTRDITRVTITVRIDGGGVGATGECAPLSPGSVCASVPGSAGNMAYRFCEVTVQGSKTAVRATFCDLTQWICVPGQ